MQKLKVLLFTESEVEFVDVPGLMAVGGSQSSGINLKSLKETNDYAVLSVSDDVVNVHPLKGKRQGAQSVKPFEKFSILDLSFIPIHVPLDAKATEPDRGSQFIDEIAKVFSLVSSETDLLPVFNRILSSLIQILKVEKGFVVAKDKNEKFEIVAEDGINPNDPWLSESLLSETLRTQNPLFIQNVIGSHFENNKSLTSTGFLSVFTWPLRLRGQMFGALVVGSTKPHSGLDILESKVAGLYSQIAAYVLSVHLKDRKLQEQVEALKLIRKQENSPFVTTSQKLRKVCELAQKIAPSELSLLIQGETGVGKEVLARWVHENSDFCKGPFVAVNCGAIPENLIESALFGHKKGAFTGAFSDQLGKFQVAHQGTLFLDEVGDLPASVQVKLLRALQEKMIEPVGAHKPTPVRVRVISASHKNILELVKQGKFREDLYYRIAEMTLEIPALRERPEDIGLIVSQYLSEQNYEKKLSSTAWEWLKTQNWQGNVRELLSHLKRAVILSAGIEIEVGDFNCGPVDEEKSNWLGGRTLEDASQKFLLSKVNIALQLSNGNRKVAAELLGITPRTLFRYLEDMREV